MKHLFSVWGAVSKELERKYICLFLDCDGTLAPIADTPAQAVIPQKTKEALASLSRLEGLRLAIISGRLLADIKTIIGLDGIIYVGNHGLEIDGPGVTSQWKIVPSYKDILADIKARLTRECASMPGVFIEDKRLALCLHYRMSNMDEENTRAVFNKIADPYRSSGKIAVMYGKKIIEVRPSTGWDKGKVVRWLLDRERLLVKDENIIAVYVGDDRTDEDAFKALGESEISVMVGNVPALSAKYYVDDTDEVYKFLTMILEARKRLI
jgi:trehalose-phosphatase